MTTQTTPASHKGQWLNPGHELPTLDDCVTGVVGLAPDPDNPSRNLMTVQCSTCHATYTDSGILAVRAINFARPSGFGHEPFRRCATCRDEDRQPDAVEYLRHIQRVREKARGALTRSEKFRELQNRSLKARGAEHIRLHAQLEDMLRQCDNAAREEAEASWQDQAASPAATAE